MRKPLLDSLGRNRVGTALTAHLPAPTGGWNTRDSLADMDPLDATILENWFPRSGECVHRGGSLPWATGMSTTVKTMFKYTPANGSEKLFAAVNAGIYDVTATGAVGATVMALTDGYINGVNLTNSAGTSYWWGCNGADSVKTYDGTTWATITSAITNVTAANLIFPWLFKHRIFVLEKTSMNAWFLPLDSIQGPAGKLPLGNLFRRGGYLVSGTSWTLDAGDGADDLCVFISSEGEVAIYKGTDPTSASSWSLVGVYYVGKPLGRRCFFRLGGDVGVLLENGVFPLSKLLVSGSVNFASALSNKIQPTFTSQVTALVPTTQGWEALVFPNQDALLVNLPTVSIQYAMNTVTGAWSSFRGWNYACGIVKDGAIYFGSAGGKVYKAWDGILVADSDAYVVGLVKQAWNYFGKKTLLKRVDLMRPLFAYDGTVETKIAISPDYSVVSIDSTLMQVAGETGALWDVSFWNTSNWGLNVSRRKLWRAANHNPGFALALWLQTSTNDSNLSWSGTDFILSSGGAI